MSRVLLTHSPAARQLYYGDKALTQLQQLADVRLHHAPEPLDTAALIEASQGCAIIVSDRATAGTAELFEHAEDLVAFVRCAVDIRTIDVAAASANGVLVTRASPGFITSVAELALGMMVDLARGLTTAALSYRSGATPAATMGRQLAGSTLGIIGYGAIGSHLAGLGKALGMHVLVHDPYKTINEPGITVLGLDDLLRRSDFAVCLAIANAETENLLGAAQFAQMSPTAYFINLSRGNLIDENALQAALENGQIAGAAMDVGRAPDQMPSPALAALPNVLATPHIGGLTPTAIEHQALETVRQVEALLQGEIPPGAVNAEQATRLARIRHE